MTDAVLTLQEVADELGVHYMTAYRYVRLGVMDASKSGGVWQVPRSAVDRFREQEQSIFAPWALYVDHAHLSPRATRLLAERIHAAIPEAATLRAEARAR